MSYMISIVLVLVLVIAEAGLSSWICRVGRGGSGQVDGDHGDSPREGFLDALHRGGILRGSAVRRRVVWSSRDVVRYGQNHDRTQRSM